MAHLTLKQRYRIEIYISENKTLDEIGRYIDKDKSVVCREIKRNSDARNGKYKAALADSKAQKRHSIKAKRRPFTDEIKLHVKELLKLDYSPEQIKGSALVDGLPCVSHETIYKFIWKDKKSGGTLFKHLRNRGRRYRKRSDKKDSREILINRVDIDKRPEIVNRKERIGDLEIDLVIGKGHQQALLTINDRATGYLFMSKVLSKEAKEIEIKTTFLLEDWKPLLHTITSDNGKEFANHESIAEKLDVKFYFAKPYHSWQRGANENLNGLVRQYIPKDHDFKSISDDDILNVQNILNTRPRKRLGFKSPKEVFAFKLDQLAKVAFIN